MKIINIVGARPNFMKVAPLHKEFSKNPFFESIVVHTGQHFDAKMSDVFFNQLELPIPDYFLGVGTGSHTMVTAKIMTEFEPILLKENPDLVLVVGDVTSTLACALVAVRNNIKVAHVEAGLRSFDRQMPEEINRILTDQISDFLFITEKEAKINLLSENIAEHKIHFVGNCMIDSLHYYLPKIDDHKTLQEFNLNSKEYILVTMHRPSNVDTKDGLEKINFMLNEISQHHKIVFPIHPRTSDRLNHFGLLGKLKQNKNINLCEPQGYLEFIALMKNCSLILTDSGGVQEESTFLNIPCLTFRKTTERPITVTVGTNQLLDELNPDTAIQKTKEILNGKIKSGQCPELWDGYAASRIAQLLQSSFYAA